MNKTSFDRKNALKDDRQNYEVYKLSGPSVLTLQTQRSTRPVENEHNTLNGLFNLQTANCELRT